MEETNGEGKSRLDRIEELIERSEIRNAQQVTAKEAAHDRFNAQYQQLLTSQVLMTETMTKLDIKMLETTEKLDALIQTVDDWIRHNPRPDAQA
jgi:hypothetical protein